MADDKLRWIYVPSNILEYLFVDVAEGGEISADNNNNYWLCSLLWYVGGKKNSWILQHNTHTHTHTPSSSSVITSCASTWLPGKILSLEGLTMLGADWQWEGDIMIGDTDPLALSEDGPTFAVSNIDKVVFLIEWGDPAVDKSMKPALVMICHGDWCYNTYVAV